MSKPHPMLADDRTLEMVRAIDAGLESHLAALSLALTADDERRIARLAIRLNYLRVRAWSMDEKRARSIDARAMRLAVQQAERELDEAVEGLKAKR